MEIDEIALRIAYTHYHNCYAALSYSAQHALQYQVRSNPSLWYHPCAPSGSGGTDLRQYAHTLHSQGGGNEARGCGATGDASAAKSASAACPSSLSARNSPYT